MTDLMQLGQQAKDSAQQLALMPTNRKNELLVQMAQTIKKNQQAIIEANHKDLEKAVENNISETMQDRLQLTPERINAMATEIEKIASLDDPIGKVDEMWTNTDGLRIGKKRVPLGVTGIIYESRPNVTTETLLIHSEIAPFFLPAIEKELVEHGVSLRADARALEYLETAALAEDTDWDTEYLDYILAVKVVDSLDEAIAHINRHNTKHSETIVTDSYAASQRFLNEVDAAAVYVNASTRFTDGSVFGFGAEIGISTQKLHARGPMGLNELTSTKYIIYGDGQIRE